jgi:hypothetical protein
MVKFLSSKAKRDSSDIDSDLRPVLDQPFGFVSAAEGFVFLSGILTGRIDSPQAHNSRELDLRARRRAWRAYGWHAVGLIGVWLWVQGWLLAGQGTPWSLPYLFHHAPFTGLASALLLLYQPGMLDILPMYVGFPLLAPLVLRFHRQGLGLAVWLVSGVIWGADQLLAPPHPIEWGPINTGAFHFLSWQWLFISGVLLGAEPHWEREALRRPKLWTVTAAAVGVIFLWIVRRPELPNWWDLDTLRTLTNKTPLASLRLLNFGLLAYLLGLLGTRHPHWLVARPLALLGRHALPVFTVSIWCAQISLCFPEAAAIPLGRWIATAFVVLGALVTAAACDLLSQRRRIRPLPAASRR